MTKVDNVLSIFRSFFLEHLFEVNLMNF